MLEEYLRSGTESGTGDGAEASSRFPAGAVTAHDRAQGAHVLLDKAILRLAEIVDLETAALQSRAAVDLRDFNNRKSQGLHELNQILRQLAGRGADGAIIARLGGLRQKLEVNRSVLKMHLEAAREISTIVSDAIREAESDGTYSAHHAGGSA